MNLIILGYTIVSFYFLISNSKKPTRNLYRQQHYHHLESIYHMLTLIKHHMLIPTFSLCKMELLIVISLDLI